MLNAVMLSVIILNVAVPILDFAENVYVRPVEHWGHVESESESISDEFKNVL